MPPPPVFQALWSSFQVSLPGSPGFGTAYQRHSSLPVLTSSAATQPRVPPSPAPFWIEHLAVGDERRGEEPLLVAELVLGGDLLVPDDLAVVAVDGDDAAVGQVGDHQVFPERDAARARRVALVRHAGVGDPRRTCPGRDCGRRSCRPCPSRRSCT